MCLLGGRGVALAAAGIHAPMDASERLTNCSSQGSNLPVSRRPTLHPELRLWSEGHEIHTTICLSYSDLMQLKLQLCIHVTISFRFFFIVLKHKSHFQGLYRVIVMKVRFVKTEISLRYESYLYFTGCSRSRYSFKHKEWEISYKW